MNALSFGQQWLLALAGAGATLGVVFAMLDHPVDLDDDEADGAPCCPDPGCPGRGNRPCTFPGYVDGN